MTPHGLQPRAREVGSVADNSNYKLGGSCQHYVIPQAISKKNKIKIKNKSLILPYFFII